MRKKPEEMTLAELRPFMSEYVRRKRGKRAPTPAKLELCPKCGKMTTARQRRYACPHTEAK